jgi:hypothetical protein
MSAFLEGVFLDGRKSMEESDAGLTDRVGRAIGLIRRGRVIKE